MPRGILIVQNGNCHHLDEGTEGVAAIPRVL